MLESAGPAEVSQVQGRLGVRLPHREQPQLFEAQQPPLFRSALWEAPCSEGTAGSVAWAAAGATG